MYAIDIETAPNLDMIEYLPEPKADTRLRDEVKIKEDIAKKKAEQIDKMALSPEFGKIACIGIYGKDKKDVLVGEEKNIIKDFLPFLLSCENIITFNGKNFDFDFIVD